jgi:hypothetical protein
MPVDYSAIVEAFVLSRKPALMTVFENEPLGLVTSKAEIHRDKNCAQQKCATLITVLLF